MLLVEILAENFGIANNFGRILFTYYQHDFTWL